MDHEQRDALARSTFDQWSSACDDPAELYGVLGRLRFLVERSIASAAREESLHHDEAVAALRLQELQNARVI